MAEQRILTNLPFIRILPDWAQELSYKYCSNTANLFIVYGNIRDFLPHKNNEDQFIFVKIQNYISEVLFGNRDIIIFYDRSSGISFARPDMRQDFLAEMRRSDGNKPTDELLSTNPVTALKNLEKYFYVNMRHRYRIVLLIDYAEAIIPNTSFSSYTDEDRYCLVTLNRWATDPLFVENDISIILLTENLNDLSHRLVRSPATVKVNIPLPDQKVRNSFLDFLLDQEKLILADKLDTEEVAKITSGLNLVNLNQIAAESYQENKEIDLEYLRKNNKDANILARHVIHDAIALCPEYSEFYTLLGYTHLMELYFQSNNPLISIA